MGAFWLRTQTCFVTWCRSRIDDVAEFERLLRAKMRAGTLVFGCREYHADGVSHYHAVLWFPEEVYWQDAHEKLRLVLKDGTVDTRSIRIRVPKKGQSMEHFLRVTQRYCAKNENEHLFGKRFIAPSRKDYAISVKVTCRGCATHSEVESSWYCGGCLKDGAGSAVNVRGYAFEGFKADMICRLRKYYV
jgi:hypothetical protein